MKVCAACKKELPAESFSKKQWRLKQQERRCKQCIVAARDAQPRSPAKNDATEIPGHACWICLDDGPSDAGEYARRDCSCRGPDAGFAHLACLVEYATRKSRSWDLDRFLGGHSKLEEFTDPWSACAVCRRPHQNEFSVDLANEFVTFAKKTYRGRGAGERFMNIVAMRTKLHAFLSWNSYPAEEAKDLAHKALSLIEQTKLTPTKHASSKRMCLEYSIRDEEHMVSSDLANVFRCQGLSEEALKYYEQCRDIGKALDSPRDVLIAEKNIALVKSDVNAGLEYCKKVGLCAGLAANRFTFRTHEFSYSLA